MNTPNQTEERRHSGMVREVAVPIGSLIIALAGIMLSFYSLTTQIWLQESQVKYRGYGAVMGELHMAFYKSGGSLQSTGDHMNKAWAEYYMLETFVRGDQRGELRKSLVDVILACEEAERVHNNPSDLLKAEQIFSSRLKAFGEKLEEHLSLSKR